MVGINNHYPWVISLSPMLLGWKDCSDIQFLSCAIRSNILLTLYFIFGITDSVSILSVTKLSLYLVVSTVICAGVLILERFLVKSIGLSNLGIWGVLETILSSILEVIILELADLLTIDIIYWIDFFMSSYCLLSQLSTFYLNRKNSIFISFTKSKFWNAAELFLDQLCLRGESIFKFKFSSLSTGLKLLLTQTILSMVCFFWIRFSLLTELSLRSLSAISS